MDYINIRGEEIRTVDRKRAIYEKLPGFNLHRKTTLEKLEDYDRRHSIQRMGGQKKNGKPDPISNIGHTVPAYSKRKKGAISEKPDAQGRVRWVMIYAHNKASYPYATQKIQFKAYPDFKEAYKEAIAILNMLCVGSGSKPKDMTLLSVSLINILEDNMLEMGVNVKEIVNKRKGRG